MSAAEAVGLIIFLCMDRTAKLEVSTFIINGLNLILERTTLAEYFFWRKKLVKWLSDLQEISAKWS